MSGRGMIVLLAMLAFPAHAQLERLHPVTDMSQAQHPDADASSCERLADTMDAVRNAGLEWNKDELDRFVICVDQFSCDRSREIAKRNTAPVWARQSNAGEFRWLRLICGK